MDLKTLLTTFGMIFLAELGDKTQLATFAFSADTRSPLSVFVGSASALILTSLLAVLLGAAIGKVVPQSYIKIGAGLLFVGLGLCMIVFPGGK